jgi:MerR family transcriptional regulator/heat shock protein HspR
MMFQPEPDDPLYPISVVAKMLRLHEQTLRMYERLGLLSPARVSGKNRLYSQNDVQTIERIVYLVRERRLNLAGVRMVMEIVNDPEHQVERIRIELHRTYRSVNTIQEGDHGDEDSELLDQE